MSQSIEVARMVFAIALNTVGLAAVLAAAWFMPTVLDIIVSSGGMSG
jgi:hypothetical protein